MKLVSRNIVVEKKIEKKIKKIKKRNIVVEDPRPTMQLFMLLLSNAGMDTCNGHLVSRGPGDVHGIVFQVQLLYVGPK